MCFKNLLSKAIPAFATVALAFAGCDKVQTPPSENPTPEVRHFTVEVTDITTTGCTVSIAKDDEDQLFYYGITRKKDFEELGKTFQERAKAYYEGDIAFYTDELGYTEEEAIAEITSGVDLEDFPIDYLYGKTTFVLIVGYIKPDGTPAGDFECTEFETPAPQASDNKLTITVSDVTARTAHISVTTTNSDQYTVRCFPATQFGDLAGEELAAEMLYYYMLWGGDANSGDFEDDFEKLKADTKYIAAAVGYTDCAATTDIVTAEFTTLKAGDAGKWKLTSVKYTDGDYKGYRLNAEMVPNDPTIDYCYELIPTTYTEEAFLKQFKENLVLSEEEGLDKEDYIEIFGAYGTYTAEYLSVKPGQSYRIAAVPVDPVTREFVGVIFSEPITIETPEASTVAVTSVEWDKYFDGAAIAEIDKDYSYFGDNAVFRPVVTTDVEDYFYYVFEDDGKTYTKEDIVYKLLDYGYRWSNDITAPFDADAVIYAVAADENGLFGPVYEKKCKFTKTGAASADGYFDQTYPGEEAKTAAVRKAKGGDTDAKKAAVEKIRRNWTKGNLSTFDAE